MSEDVLSSLDVDLSDVPMGQPVIDNQNPLCRTGEVTLKRLDNGAMRLVIPLTLEEAATSTDGRALNVGFTTTVGFLATEHKGWTKDRANQALAEFQVAVLKLDKPRVFRASELDQYSGQLVRPKFRAQRNDPTRQDVRGWMKAGS